MDSICSWPAPVSAHLAKILRFVGAAGGGAKAGMGSQRTMSTANLGISLKSHGDLT